MFKVPEIFKTKNKTLSFELFPPKTDKGYQNLLNTIARLCELKPDFFSCTYGAGGGSRDKTLDIVQMIQEKHQTSAVAHLTCVCHTRNEIKSILENIKDRGISNVLALRGDPPVDNPDWTPGDENFVFSYELVAFIRELFGEHFGIGVAGFPEGHILCPDLNRDARFLKNKINQGADYIITQLFFDNQVYFDYLNRLQELNVTARVIPGILPITNYQGLLKFIHTCGTVLPQKGIDIFEPIQDDPQKTFQAGLDFAAAQCEELLAGGAPGLHFYTLNKIEPVKSILAQLHY